MIIVIPCLAEEKLEDTVESLFQAAPTLFPVEIIVAINEPEDADPSIRRLNQQSLDLLREMAAQKSSPGRKLLPYYDSGLPKKHAGVGLARKIGMDEALRRFHDIAHPDGVIVCLDADCTVDPNYLQEIEKHFEDNPRSVGANIYFEHPLENEAIVYYELFLRYYINALRHAAYPYAYHSVGSAMAVRAKYYAAEGGMNRRKAGEDFYFIHKFIPRGQFHEINSTRVIPLARKSERVPFGTGRAIGEFENNPDKIRKCYDFRIFNDLKTILNFSQTWFDIRDQELSLKENYHQWPESFKSFFSVDDFLWQIAEARENSNFRHTFNKRIFQWLDAFRILKYVHFARDVHFPNRDILEVSMDLLRSCKISVKEHADAKELLWTFRKLDKEAVLLDQIIQV